MNIFESASRKKLRFNSSRGEITTENLWSLPLTARDGFSLDGIGREVQKALKADDEESLVAPSKSPEHADNVLRLEIIKHVITEKQAQVTAHRERMERASRREALQEALVAQENAAIQSMTPEQIKAELAKLED